ncbi:MAG: MarR family transcriptional regulator [Saprospiraceae bacterium]|nr:MAG: MarR family transcriptional regulator [Saprospiraceae bacterium]
MKKSAFDTAHQTGSTGGKIVVALERISEAFRVLLWNEGKSLGLSPLQVQVLIFLLHHSEVEKRKVGQLATEFNMTKATISDAVKTLETKGLVEKDFGQQDQRSFAIHLTPTGQAIARQTSHFTEEIQTPIENLPPGEQANLLLNLLSIIRHLNQTGIIGVQRMCFNCVHYGPGHEGHPHFCKLLNAPLKTAELRVDCPEHELRT